MLKNIYATGSSLLFNSQAAINVHGQNLANVSTPGYRRRTVEMGTNPYIKFGDYEFGTGAEINRLRRHFDDYIARQQENKSGENSMWQAVRGNLASMDAMFKDSGTKGLTKALTDFWNQWQTVSEHPDQDAARTSLLGKTKSLMNLLQNKRSDMDRQMQMMDKAIGQETDRVNSLMRDLAEVNKQIVGNEAGGALADQRDRIIEKMAAIVPVKTVILENGQASVSMVGGQTLVDGVSAFEFKFEGPKTIRELINGSTFQDTVHYKGNSKSEYTVECVKSGPADGSAGAGTFRVSIDGGKTWISNPDGSTKTFTANGPGNEIKVGDMSIWFGKTNDSTGTPTTDLTKGDRFVIKPKKNLFWYKTSSSSEDVTPYNGNEKAISGGSLAGLLRARDHVSNYRSKLDALAKSLVWEVNYAHSQGAGTKHLDTVVGTYKMDDTSKPLSASSLPFAEKLTKGNFSIAVYNKSTGKHMATKPLDFSSITPGTPAFDPAVHSLENVRDAINATYPGQASAAIEDGKLRISGTSTTKISFAGDSSGLLAGLGINTFLQGSNSSDIEVNSALKNDISRICAGHVNGAGEVNSGDNTIARKLAAMSTRVASFSTESGTNNSTFQEYLSNLIAQVGSDVATAESGVATTGAQLKFLNDRQQEVGGVNAKEEMIKIKQYQQHYQAASKLIGIANEMFDTLLALK